MFQSIRLMIAALIVASATAAPAGMPAPLPSNWTSEKTPDWVGDRRASISMATGLRVQAISFFIAVFLVSGWMVKGRVWALSLGWQHPCPAGDFCEDRFRRAEQVPGNDQTVGPIHVIE